MVRPILPPAISNSLPIELVRNIYSYVPHNEKKEKPVYSPSLQAQLEKLHVTHMKGVSGMYLKGLDDFCLD
jgi:hypothetical protein